jgi:hypothetical protein
VSLSVTLLMIDSLICDAKGMSSIFDWDVVLFLFSTLSRMQKSSWSSEQISGPVVHVTAS